MNNLDITDLAIRMAINLTERNGEIAQLKRTVDNLHKTVQTLREYIADLEQCNWYDHNAALFNAPSGDEPYDDEPEPDKYVFNSSQVEKPFEFREPQSYKFITMYTTKED